MINRIKDFFNLTKKEKTEKKMVIAKFPSTCLICEKEMNSLKINHPFCNECLYTLKDVINKKNKKNERKSKKI